MKEEQQAMLSASVDIGRTALWNYVSLIVWLRWLKWFRIIFNVLPIVLGGLGSWRIITDSQKQGVAIIGSALALAAGLIPLLYLASGIEDNIGNATHIAGEYRVLEGRVRDFVIRYWSLSPHQRGELYQKILEQHLGLRARAHTVPRWAFRAAERRIAAKDYIPVSNADAVASSE